MISTVFLAYGFAFADQSFQVPDLAYKTKSVWKEASENLNSGAFGSGKFQNSGRFMGERTIRAPGSYGSGVGSGGSFVQAGGYGSTYGTSYNRQQDRKGGKQVDAWATTTPAVAAVAVAPAKDAGFVNTGHFQAAQASPSGGFGFPYVASSPSVATAPQPVVAYPSFAAPTTAILAPVTTYPSFTQPAPAQLPVYAQPAQVPTAPASTWGTLTAPLQKAHAYDTHLNYLIIISIAFIHIVL
jgi:hypothetical protein